MPENHFDAVILLLQKALSQVTAGNPVSRFDIENAIRHIEAARPNADGLAVFLEEHKDHGIPYLAANIAEAVERGIYF